MQGIIPAITDGIAFALLPLSLTSPLAVWGRQVVKGIVNSRATDAGGVEYKVRYAGLDKSGDEWLAASAVSADHVQNFEARKAKKSAAAKGGAEAPKPEEKKRKAPEVRAPAPPAPPRP